MITFCNRENIDIAAYNNCINEASNYRIYAKSWYLDAVADNWGVLVLGNYKAVMPLPWKQKLFIKYIYPPVWTQQLGIFSKDKLQSQTIVDFIEAIPKEFKKITLLLNSGNYTDKIHLQIRNNYVLPLNLSYTSIREAYSTNRKRDLQKANKFSYEIVENTNIEDFYKFYERNGNAFQKNEIQKTKLKLLLHLQKGKLISIKQNSKIEASVLYFLDSYRITYLLPIATSNAKKNGFSTVLIDYLINKYANTNLIFDFEGSMVFTIAKFYRSFGSKRELYFMYKTHNIGF